MADARADIIIDVDTSVGIAEIKALQRQISQLNAQLLSSGAQQARQAQNIQRNLINNINATGQFSARVKTITSTTESFTRALESNKMSMGQYFRYAGGASKTFGKLFKSEFDTIQRVAESRVKTLQTQYVKLGRDANGALKAISVRPLALDMENLATKTAIAAQKQQLYNQLLKQGSTNLLNFGKNTQWAGRQLMVGFSVPLAYLGTLASKTFMQMEEQAIRFKRVYGDTFTASSETDKMIKQVQQLATEFTKYGVQVEKTMEMAANAAAMGKQGADLLAQVNQATRLAVLGGVEQQQALETTISLTNAFGIAAEELAGKINFLNAVENQTVTSIEDLTIAVPKAGPVIQQLGGDVEDLAFFLTAMKEGGINASEGANALKSGLASLINPTDKASKFLEGFGVNIKAIVEANKGDVKGLVVDFASALDTLDPLNRARSIEQLFGKFQFSRLSTLFQNVIAEGSQAERVLKLTRNSSEELAILSERELKRVEDSPMYKFKKAVEDLKVSLVPLGEAFLKAITPLVEFAKGFMDKFNSMGEGAKNFAVIATTVVAGIGPILLMTFGLIANGVANLIKMFQFIGKTMFGAGKASTDLGAQTDYMTQQQLEAAAVASSLDQKHAKLTQTFNLETGAVNNLATAYGRAVVNQSKLLGINPETGMPVAAGNRVPRPKKYNSGVISVPGPKGKGDIVPAMLAPGEAVIPADMAQKHRGFIADMINDRLPGYRFGLNPFASMLGRSRVAVRTKQSDLEAMLQAGKGGRYKSAFETGTGADYISTAGLANPAQARLRSEMEEKMFGLGPNTPASQRPTYGYARTSPFQALINRLFGFRGKQYNSITSGFSIGDRGQAYGYKDPKTGMFGPTPNYQKDLLQRYGDIDLITKRSVARRSSGAATDSLMDYSRSSSVPGLFKLSPVSLSGKGNNDYANAQFGRLSNPFGSYKADPINYPNTFTSNPKPPYVETYTPGGFSVKEISKIVAKDRSTAKQLQKLVDEAGLRIRVTPQNAPLAVKMLANVFGTRFEDGVLNFNGKQFKLKSQKHVDSLNATIQMLKANGISDDRILSRINNLYNRDVPALTPAKLRKNFGLTAAGAVTNRGAGGSSAPQAVAKLKNKFAPEFADEITSISAYAKKLGLTDRQIKDLVTLDAAHLSSERTADGKKIWSDPKNLTADLGYVNKYISHLSQSKDSKRLMSMSSSELKAIGIDKSEMSRILGGAHPTTTKAVQTLQAIARWRTQNGSSSAARLNSKVLTYGLDKRMSSGFYSRPMKTLADLPGAKAAKVATKPVGTPKVTTPQSSFSLGKILGASRGAGAFAGILGLAGLAASMMGSFKQNQFKDGVVSVGGPKGAGDVIPAMLAPGESVIPAKMSKKYAPLIGAMVSDSIPGFKDGRVQQMANSAAMERLGLSYNTRGQLVDAETKRFADKARKLEFENLRKDKALLDEQKKLLKEQRSGRFGSLGTVGMIGSTAGMGMMMSGDVGLQQAGGAVMVASMLAPMLPMLANPFVAAGAAVAALAAGMFLLNEQFKKTVKQSYDLTMATGASADSLKKFAEFSGNVTAGEIMDRRRAAGVDVFQTAAGKTAFGDAYLQSEAGKSLQDSFAKSVKSQGRQGAIASLTNQMAVAVASGALEAGQARDIVAALGKQLNDYPLSISVNSQLLSIMGPNGENLISDPLEIRLKIIKDAALNVENIFPELPKAEPSNTSGTVQVANGGKAGGPVGDFLNWLSENDTLGITGWFDGMTSEDNAAKIGQFIGMSSIALQTQQEMADSLRVQYDQLIANAEAEGNVAEAARLRKEFEQENAKLLMQNAEVVKSIQTEFNSADVATQGKILRQYKTMTDEMFKDDPIGKAILEGAESQLAALEDDKEVVIRASILSGDLAPSSISSLLNGEDSEKQIDLLIKLGSTGFNQASQIAQLFGEGTVTVPVATTTGSASGPEEARNRNLNTKTTRMSASDQFYKNLEGMDPAAAANYMNSFNPVIQSFSALGQGGLELGMSFYLENPEELEAANEKINEFKKLAEDGPITTQMIQEVYGQEMVDKIAENQTYFDSLPEDQKITYTTVLKMLGEIDPEAKKAMAINAALGGGKGEEAFKKASGGMTYDQAVTAMGVSGANAMAIKAFDTAYAETVTETQKTNDNKNTPSTPSKPEVKAKDKVANDYLSKLRELRDSSVNVSGGIKELEKKMKDGTKATTEFVGTNQKLLYKGMSKDFIDAVNGMDEETKKTFVSIKNGIVTVTKEGKALNKALSEIKLGEFQFSLVSGVAAINKQQEAMGRLMQGGMSAADAFEIVQDESLAYAIATASTSEEVEKLVEGFKKLSDAQERFQLSTPEGTQSWLDDYSGKVSGAIGKARQFFEAQRTIVNQDFETGDNKSGRNKDKINVGLLTDNIVEAQNKIAEYQYNIDDLQYDLSTIEEVEDKINEKYDERAEALNKIWEANSDIAQQQKAQLDIAQALASGDISAAARAMQEEQRRRAQKAKEDQEKALDAAREKELDNAKSAKNKTRKQLEEEILQLTKKITTIEEGSLEPNERLLRLAESARSIALEAVGTDGYLGQTEQAWGKIESAARLAVVQSDAFKESLKSIIDLIPGFSIDKNGNVVFDEAAFTAGIPAPSTTVTTSSGEGAGDGDSGTGGMTPPKPGMVWDDNRGGWIPAEEGLSVIAGAGSEPTANPNQARIDELNRLRQISRGKFQDSKDAAYKARLMQMNIDRGEEIKRLGGVALASGGMVMKRFAAGGFAMGTDTVPAMLTPGEFVMRRYAVNQYGTDTMKAINNGTFSGDSVYNYSVNVSVKSNANPDDIASSVMSRIRQIDSQRIRSNRY